MWQCANKHVGKIQCHMAEGQWHWTNEKPDYWEGKIETQYMYVPDSVSLHNIHACNLSAINPKLHVSGGKVPYVHVHCQL